MDPTDLPLLSAEHIAKYGLKKWRGFIYRHSLTSNSPIFLERVSSKLRMFMPETAAATLPVIRRSLGALLYK